MQCDVHRKKLDCSSAWKINCTCLDHGIAGLSPIRDVPNGSKIYAIYLSLIECLRDPVYYIFHAW
jgi:hypothetical protein